MYLDAQSNLVTMKKIYLMATAMLSLGMVCAQQNNEGPTSLNLKQNPSISIYQPRILNIGGARCTQNPLFTETFDDPFNDGWTTSGDGSSGNTYNPSDLWLHDYDGPSGFFSNSSERIISTSLFRPALLSVHPSVWQWRHKIFFCLNGFGSTP